MLGEKADKPSSKVAKHRTAQAVQAVQPNEYETDSLKGDTGKQALKHICLQFLCFLS